MELKKLHNRYKQLKNQINILFENITINQKGKTDFTGGFIIDNIKYTIDGFFYPAINFDDVFGRFKITTDNSEFIIYLVKFKFGKNFEIYDISKPMSWNK